ncbi:conserved protein, unknown function [Plasmodium gaboni]|uniref:Helicase-associated domain-containing protein n=1 Tax=Plasmodium gaboni TaxID=647221 RepID=A0A151LBI0_9APIC|nr:conserved protein, unknown function [Plasmodium gaboni]KYN96334.1 conserved protein, unknown function [Plasmodium gaboni]
MKSYSIYNKEQKKELFENFKNEIINLLGVHNIFFLTGKLEFEEVIKLIFILYEKKIHTLNEKSKFCLCFSDDIFINCCYELSKNNLSDFFLFPYVDKNDKEYINKKDEYEKEEKKYKDIQQYDEDLYYEKINTCKNDNKIVVIEETKLLEKILLDPLLIQYNIIILTNIYKRHSKTDLILSLLKKIILKRNDLYLFLFSDYFSEQVLHFFISYNDNVCSWKKKNNSLCDDDNEPVDNDYVKEKKDVEGPKKITQKGDNQGNECNIKSNINFVYKDQVNIKRVSNNIYDEEESYDYNKKYSTNLSYDEKCYKYKNELNDHVKNKFYNNKEHIYKKDQHNNRKNRYSVEEKKKKKKKEKDMNSYELAYGENISNMELKDIMKKGSGKKKCAFKRNNILSSDEHTISDHNESRNSTHDNKMKVINSLFENTSMHSLANNNLKVEPESLGQQNIFLNDEEKKKNKEKEICEKENEWKRLINMINKINNNNNNNSNNNSNNNVSVYIFHINHHVHTNIKDDDKNADKKFINSYAQKTDNKKIYYLKERCSNYIETSIKLIKKLFEKNKRNENILIFLNNEYEIDVVRNGLLNKGIDSKYILIIYDINNMNDEFSNSELKNKIILLRDLILYYKKIKNINYIIDTCYMRDEIYNYDMNITNRYTILCNKTKCEERAYISTDSICFRLITIDDYNNLLNDIPLPEILRKDIFYNIFFLKFLGIQNLCSFDFVTAPSLKSLKKCFELFYILKLMDINGNIIIDKKKGLLICSLPLKFRYSIFLINSIEYNCLYEVCVIISMLINEPLFLFNHKNLEKVRTMRLSLMAEESDLLSYYNIFQNFLSVKNKKDFCHSHFLVYKSLKKALHFFNRLKYILKRFGISMKPSGNIKNIFKAVIASFYYNVSKIKNSYEYELLNQTNRGHLFSIDPLSIINEINYMKRKFIVYTDAYTNNSSKFFMKNVTAIDPSWLVEVYPSYFLNKHAQKEI